MLMNGREKEIIELRSRIYGPILNDMDTLLEEATGSKAAISLIAFQKHIKQYLSIKTVRGDWRTRQGVVLWFCAHWSDIFENYLKPRLNENGKLDSERIQREINATRESQDTKRRSKRSQKEVQPSFDQFEATDELRPKRGRPKGSKNKRSNTIRPDFESLGNSTLFEEPFLPPPPDDGDIHF